MPTHYAGHQDSLTPLGATLVRKNTAGRLVAFDLTGRVVKVIVRDEDEAVVVAETAVGVTVTSAASGQVAYDFPEGDDALAVGWYYVQFRVYGMGGENDEHDTYPAPDPKQRMRVYIGTV